MTTHTFQLGSVSTGLRQEDLLQAFADTLSRFYAPDADFGFWTVLIAEARAHITHGCLDPDDAQGCLDTLIEELQAHCPPFVFFGPHPGDGADWGFWPDWDALNDRCPTGPRWDMPDGQSYKYGDEYHLIECIVKREYNDMSFWDNITVFDRDRDILWTTSTRTSWR